MKIILIIFFLCVGCIAYGQPTYSPIRQGNIWMFGDSIGLDFGISPPLIFKSNSNYKDYSVAAICDTLGSLKYYDNAQSLHITNVFNKLGQWIQSSIQLMVNFHSLSWFLPFTNTPKIGYVVSYNEKNDPNYHLMNKVYYSRLLDTLNQNMGGWYGDLNLGISVMDSIRCWGAAPVRHANGRDWWLVARRFNGDTMYVMLATPDTMNMVHRQKIGTNNAVYSLSPTGGASGSELVFSMDGAKLLNVNGEGLVEVYDFDRCSGLLSNTIQIEAPLMQNGVARRLMYSSCLSPSGRFIYSPQADMQTQLFELVQYDLNAPDPTASRYVIFSKPFVNSFFNSIRLAPDGRIYIKPQYNQNVSTIPIDTMSLSIVNYPDSLGAGCGFVLNGFYVGTRTIGMYFSQAPNYDLGPIDGSPCDTLNIDTRLPDADTTVHLSAIKDSQSLLVYPNPVQDVLQVSSTTGMEILSYAVLDLQGRECLQYTFDTPETHIAIDMKSLLPGCYIAEVQTRQGVVRKKVVRME